MRGVRHVATAAVERLVKEKARRRRLAGTIWSRSSTKPRAIWLMVPAAVVDQDASPTSTPLLEPGDILIDGGNSYYVDDIRRAKELAQQRN